jgi:hypothetical protein
MIQIVDQDGNVIREGMAVVSGGDVWIVGGICSARVNGFVRLDRRRPDGRLECRLLGRRRWRCIHVIGFQHPPLV